MTMSMDDGTIGFDPGDVAQEPIPTLRELRILPAPKSLRKPESQPGNYNTYDPAVLVVDFDKFWLTAIELLGSGMANMRRYGEKLRDSVLDDAPAQIQARIQQAYADGAETGKALADDDPREITENPIYQEGYKAGYDAAQGGSGVHLPFLGRGHKD